MRRKLLIGALALLVAVGAAAAVFYRYETRSREVLGSSTEEFVAQDNPADVEPAKPPRPTKPLPDTKPRPRRSQGPRTDEAWPTYGVDEARTHVAPGLRHRPPFRRLWMMRAGHYIEFPPAVAYGRVYVSQQRGRFFAVDGRTGKVAWSKNYRRCSAASPTAHAGVVYAAYMHPLPCAKHLPGARGFVIALNARTGRELWSFRAGAVESSPLLVGKTLFFGSWDRKVYAVDIRTRKLRWSYTTDDRVVAAPAYDDGTLYAATNGGRVYAFDSHTGRLRWRASSFARFGRREYFYATPTVAYGRVYAASTDGYVYSFGARSGRLIWAQRAGTYVYTAPAVWRRRVYVGTWDGYVVAFDAASGRELWRHDAPGGVSGAPAVMNGLLYFSTLGPFDQGKHQRRVESGPNATFALDARSGRRVWSFPDGAYSPLVADTERVYLVGRTRVYGLAERPARRVANAKPKVARQASRPKRRAAKG